jgi:hypothetical protein
VYRLCWVATASAACARGDEALRHAVCSHWHSGLVRWPQRLSCVTGDAIRVLPIRACAVQRRCARLSMTVERTVIAVGSCGGDHEREATTSWLRYTSVQNQISSPFSGTPSALHLA